MPFIVRRSNNLLDLYDLAKDEYLQDRLIEEFSSHVLPKIGEVHVWFNNQ